MTTRPKAQWTLALSSSPQASPGARPTILNYDTYIYASITCALGLGIVWNPRCMIPRFPWSYTSMYRTIEMLCLIDLGRSRVISDHSRDIGNLIILNIWNIGVCRKGKEFGDRAGKG